MTARTLETGCTIEVSHTNEAFHAHVELDGNVPIGPGDRVLVHGGPISVPFGQTFRTRRQATVTRAGALGRALTRLKARFALSELYEVSFTPGRLP